MTDASRLQPPPRYGPIPHQTWPQDENRIPNTSGLAMPPVSEANVLRSRRESFTMSGRIAIPNPTRQYTNFSLYLPTDPDGDFWCDQIYMVGWVSNSTINDRPPPGIVSIRDARTQIALTWPQGISANFLTTSFYFSEEPGFDPGSYALPSGLRSTSTLPQPFCFTRAGGIQIDYTMFVDTVAGPTWSVDIAFGGWKEYEAASA